jgi:DNA (cytosine-5)-methyltransferase 1
MTMRVGSLFTGYGGLDMAVGGELAWYAEIEKAACQVLATHHPNVANLGDITAINWADVQPVDVITGGYPCQPFSHAGNRKGKNDVRHLWPNVLDAIRAIRPTYAILENVSGHLTLGFADVLADLAEIGWSCEWGTFQASDVGAPHRRERIFIIAHATRGIGGRGESDSRSVDDVADTTNLGLQFTSERLWTRGPATTSGHQRFFADTKSTSQGCDIQQRGLSLQSRGSVGDVADTDWGKYAPAIARWEAVLERGAPAPTIQRNDKRRLNPRFVEWMMGLPDGWVTGHGLSAAKELKMLGNGVVPQQAHAAITQLLERITP